MKLDYIEQAERKQLLNGIMNKLPKTEEITNLIDRACRVGLPKGMSLIEFEDYIRGLYPEHYISRVRNK